jgi:hypothetical protein
MFDQSHLASLGFVGFKRLLDPALGDHTPAASGIYAVVADPSAATKFLQRSVGGRFKAKDPTVDPALLAAKQIDGCATLYIGRASNLHRRLAQFARFGRGEPVGHWGGRYLWQLADHHQLRVAWRVEDDPVRAEADLLDDFEASYGQLPYANLVRGKKPRQAQPPPKLFDAPTA